jgi:hypothetical protein
MFYVASRALAEEPFLTYEHETTMLINELFLYFPVKGPPLQTPYPLQLEKQTPDKPLLYGASHGISLA